ATLDGDVIEPSGVVTSGKGSMVLRHLRTIRELRQKAGKDEYELTALVRSLALATTERDSLKLDLQELNEEAIDADKEISINKVNLKKHREDKERLDKKLHYIKVESEETDKEIKHLGASISEKEDLLAALRQQKEDVATYIQGLRDTQGQMRARLELFRAGSTGKKVDLTRRKERLRSVQSERASLLRKTGSLEEKLSSIAGETGGLTAKRDDASKELREGELRAEALRTLSVSLREEFEVLRVELDGKKALIKEKEKALHLLKNDRETTKERMSDLEVRLMEHRLRMENIKSIVSNTYGKCLDDLDVVPPTESDEAKIPGLKQKIQDMGPVNLASIEEYGELNTRYDFLSTQQSDIVQSIGELDQAISKINATTKARLGEAFAQLNQKFQETFKSFFGGGDAGLTLTDSANILEAGIEITVQPPGKRLQNINLLSGGEKALSALSLIFAGFLIKPTPLCLLDEADAALDEANTGRFAGMLKTISDKTQFIVITHNRTTMEVADYIYGITNEAAGISKVISVELSGVTGKSEA
ncbi:MAG: AAA family ATPase, partial [Nitrospirae bacterium]|nr:AAA family ATPase [Nitrospirota bacterium]